MKLLPSDYMKDFRQKGLICFEEITDYSILTDQSLKTQLKRKRSTEQQSPLVSCLKAAKNSSKKSKLSDDTNEATAASKSKKAASSAHESAKAGGGVVSKKKPNDKSVKFNKSVLVLNKDDADASNVIKKKKADNNKKVTEAATTTKKKKKEKKAQQSKQSAVEKSQTEENGVVVAAAEPGADEKAAADKSKAKLKRSKSKKRKQRRVRKLKEEARQRKAKKSNVSHSTSRMSLHVAGADNADQVLTDADGQTTAANGFDETDFEQKMSAWSGLMLPKVLLRGLYDSGFYEPMPIQKLVLPEAIKQRSNIIGTAQTGSGKTLAFGLPILTHLYDSFEIPSDNGVDAAADDAATTAAPVQAQAPHAPQALILTPTRELAVQIKDHLQTCCKYQKTKIVVVVGGISQLKQERLLKKSPEIVVATPGRLMQMIEEGNEYLSLLPRIKYFVIDEADRMIEKGHFGEMEKILALVNSDEKLKAKRQNFLFSATLITKFGSGDDGDEKQRSKSEAQLKREQRELLASLVDKLQMSKQPKLFDLTTAALTADTLLESKIFCPLKDKDMYLYYFMCKYGGRTLVFANSIDCVRRLTNLFRLLDRAPLHLHANMNQKQRLKNLEKFNAEENSVLIASDVASRGLDIPGVMHVIHYQVPRSAEIYVHRSGRTARSAHEGISVMLVAPDEIALYRKILKTFEKEKDMKDYPIENDYLDECKARVGLARQIDELEHSLGKERSTMSWYEKNARLMDIELDDELIKETQVDGNEQGKSKRRLQQLKNDLSRQLKKVVYPKYMSKSYPKTGSFEQVVSMNKADHSAINELKNVKTKSKPKANIFLK